MANTAIPLKDLLPEIVVRFFPSSEIDELEQTRARAGDVVGDIASANHLTHQEVREILDIFLAIECERHMSVAA